MPVVVVAAAPEATTPFMKRLRVSFDFTGYIRLHVIRKGILSKIVILFLLYRSLIQMRIVCICIFLLYNNTPARVNHLLVFSKLAVGLYGLISGPFSQFRSGSRLD
jgi:hypothetical protein